MKKLAMILRHGLNIGNEKAMLNAGAIKEKCPFCDNETPVYHHSNYKSATCLWCGKDIRVNFCSRCGQIFDKKYERERGYPWTYQGLDFCDSCYKRIGVRHPNFPVVMDNYAR